MYFQAVDGRNIPGMDRVDSLAEYLVGLHTQTALTLSPQQVSAIKGLWQNLLPYDRQRVVLAARHQDRLSVGKFKSTKRKVEFTPGIDSLKRSVLASPGSFAQFPDCCRAMEAIFIRLCRIHKSPKRRGEGSVSRWSLILESFRNIRELIHNNGAIMQDTELQLIDVNLATLKAWYNQRVKRQDVGLLLQGINLPPRISLASEPLSPALVRPTAAGTLHPPNVTCPVQARRQAIVPLPVRPAGIPPAAPAVVPQPVQLARKRPAIAPFPAVPPVRPKMIFPKPGPIILFPQAIYTRFPTTAPPGIPIHPPIPPVFVPQVQSAPVPPASSRPEAVPPASSRPARIRTNKRTVVANSCKKCGQYRTAATGHSQYRGTIYCPNTETLPLKDWLEQIKKSKM